MLAIALSTLIFISCLEFLYSLVFDTIDEIYKIKEKSLIKLNKLKFLIYKHIRCRIYFNKDYEKWALSRQEFNKNHVAKLVLYLQILLHFFCFYIFIAGLVIMIMFNEINNSLYAKALLYYPFLALFILSFIFATIVAIICDIVREKKFPDIFKTKEKDKEISENKKEKKP